MISHIDVIYTAAPVGVYIYAVQLCQRTASRYLTAVARLTFLLRKGGKKKTISYYIISSVLRLACVSLICEIVFCAPCYSAVDFPIYIIREVASKSSTLNYFYPFSSCVEERRECWCNPRVDHYRKAKPAGRRAIISKKNWTGCVRVLYCVVSVAFSSSSGRRRRRRLFSIKYISEAISNRVRIYV